jgi:2'-5' RNA ligase
MRLFVAVELDPAVAAAAAALAEELRARALRLAPRARITWIPAERLHLTVRFIGNADEAGVRAISDALAAPLQLTAFDMTISGAGSFPRSGKPQVLWAGVTAGRDGLLELEREVSTRLAGAGVAAEDRPHSPHLTLARIREAAGLRAAALLERMESRVVGTTRVAAITLFESRLSPKGPTYVPLQHAVLAGSGAEPSSH